MKHENKLKFIEWLLNRYFRGKGEDSSAVRSVIYNKLKEYDFEKPEVDPNQTHIFWEQ